MVCERERVKGDYTEMDMALGDHGYVFDDICTE